MTAATGVMPHAEHDGGLAETHRRGISNPILGMILFNEPANAGRVVCLVLIVAGIVGLKFLSPAP